ncbi:hypothetical protein SA13R_07000 [Rothia kristinae]|nr:hypothetical protein RSA5_07360 [Rothia kristinae]KTR58159.1 hypothetical protein SA11R_06200 [Rothia kristinae]KTR67542.1 hypothetical protein SA12R_06000 [Rothia kristinae]KTR74505.1 hypothetical protein SA15R_00275 [Rothia kristinae]KTR78328.1 hypothetical protein SA14R_05270 [Rothia kristinae]
MPSQDYIPLMAVLRRRLGEEEIQDVTRQLAAAGLVPADSVDIGVEITKVTDEMPSPTDVRRVEDNLRSLGRAEDPEDPQDDDDEGPSLGAAGEGRPGSPDDDDREDDDGA